MNIPTKSAALIGFVLLLPVPGCGGGGGSEDPQVQNDLKIIGLAYHNHLLEKRKTPASPEELQSYLKESNSAYTRLKDGTIVFIWNVDLKDMPERSSNTIIAYHKEVPSKGGFALYGDGSARLVTAEEF